MDKKFRTSDLDFASLLLMRGCKYTTIEKENNKVFVYFDGDYESIKEFHQKYLHQAIMVNLHELKKIRSKFRTIIRMF